MNRPGELKQREGKKQKRNKKSPIKPLPTPGPSHLPSLRGPPVRPQFACDDPAASPMPGSSRAGRVTRTRHLGELSSRSSKNTENRKWQHLYARHRLLACRVRTWRPCVAGAVVHPLFTCPPQGEARDVFQRPKRASINRIPVLSCLVSYCI
ncbi:hypothetical protein CI102_11893 [Trichoderma harzianum]|nr:hypothetical protein CI102_11893 [Trichoderma harzianum]